MTLRRSFPLANASLAVGARRRRRVEPAAGARAVATRLRRWLLVLPVLMFSAVMDHATAAAPTEEQIKAAFLINFTKYVEWPADAFVSETSPFVFMIVGDAKIEAALREIIAAKTIGSRPLRIAGAFNELDYPHCLHVLFIADGAMREMAGILARWDGRMVLTVGESAAFLDRGGVVNLARRERKVRLEVNLESAQQKGFRISSKLLKVSDVVRGPSK